MKLLVLIALSFVLALQLGCASALDPAVRVAYCIEDTVKKHKGEFGLVQTSCALEIPGGYVAVCHPEGDLTSEQLLAAGLTQSQVKVVRDLRGGTNAAIYVLSNDPKTPDSRTTYQRNFVRIPQIMVAVKSAREPLEISLDTEAEGRLIKSIH